MAFSFSTSQLSKVMALGLLLMFFLFRCMVSPFNKVSLKKKGGGGAPGREKKHNPIFSVLAVPICGTKCFSFFSELKLGRAFEMQPALWKRFSSEILSTMRTTLGVLFSLLIEIRPISGASSRPYLMKKQWHINLYPFISLYAICYLPPHSGKPRDGEK